MASRWRPAPSVTAISVPLTVRLDPDTERCLQELQQESGLDRSSLIRQLIHDRWHQRQPPVTVTARLGGQPASFLTTLPAGSAELNCRYADLPGDFADLSLVVLSERLNIAAILSLDSDCDVYCRFRRQPFQRMLLEE